MSHPSPPTLRLTTHLRRSPHPAEVPQMNNTPTIKVTPAEAAFPSPPGSIPDDEDASSPPGSIASSHDELICAPVSPSLDEPYDNLDELLRRHAREHHDRKQKSFWPLTVLKEIMTRERVLRALKSKECGIDESNIERYCDQIVPTREKSKSYMKLFTILILQNKGKDIGTFIKHEIHDKCLPLIEIRDRLTGRHGLALSKNATETHPCFKTCGWTGRDFDSFCDYQRQVSVHFFGLDKDNKINLYDISADTVLPWLSLGEDYDDDDDEREGGFSNVKKYRIDPKSHGFHELLKSVSLYDSCVAVKTLKPPKGKKNTRKEAIWRNEVDMLTRFSGKDHPCLITLLSAFTWKGRFRLLFPCAKYDLDEFWAATTAPIGPSGAIDPAYMRWVSRQIRGLMEALKFIHDPHRKELDASDVYGKHGDLKPQNVLWFESPTDERGILVITDLGLTEVHRDESKSNIPNANVPQTPGYRPPECDIEGGDISRAFDIWTMGCLFLEKVCWLLGDNEERTAFAAKRMKRYVMTQVRSNIFFDIQAHQNSNRHVVKVKDSVTECMRSLHEKERCTEFVHDFLDLIHKEMVIILSPSKKRGTSEYLVQKLSAMHERAMDETDVDYIAKCCPRKWPEPDPRQVPQAVVVDLNSKAKELATLYVGLLAPYKGSAESMSTAQLVEAQGK